MKIEFREHFRNITRVIDCVGCDKCKLWGKLQVLYQINELSNNWFFLPEGYRTWNCSQDSLFWGIWQASSSAVAKTSGRLKIDKKRDCCSFQLFWKTLTEYSRAWKVQGITEKERLKLDGDWKNLSHCHRVKSLHCHNNSGLIFCDSILIMSMSFRTHKICFTHFVCNRKTPFLLLQSSQINMCSNE